MRVESQIPWDTAQSTHLKVDPTENTCVSKTRICFSLYTHIWAYLINTTVFKKKKINLWPKALSSLLGAILIRIISKKSRKNSKLESGPNAKAAYGSRWKIVAGLIWVSKKNDRNYRALPDFKRTSQKEVEGQESHLPAWWPLVKGQGQESSGCSV